MEYRHILKTIDDGLKEVEKYIDYLQAKLLLKRIKRKKSKTEACINEIRKEKWLDKGQ
ncbi:MAG: hypothetical protein GX196_06630 [Clostridiaceae bacterium]|nr:hypothetical protein [Clostridiaceae bacterium]